MQTVKHPSSLPGAPGSARRYPPALAWPSSGRSLPMRFLAFVLLALSALAGCGETSSPTLPPGTERDPFAPGSGGTGGGGAGGVNGTGGAAGAGGAAGGTSTGGSGGSQSWCETSELCPSCPDIESLCDEETPCPTGEVCVSTGCEDLSRCFTIGGGRCEDDVDCGSPTYACDPDIGRCLRVEPGCDDSNDCVAGFACEGGSCVDRRLPCATATDCPHGYTCFFNPPDQRFCRRISRPCGDDFDCLVLGVLCGDADGDGQKECMPSLSPNEPDAVACDVTQCGAARVCEASPEGTSAVCGSFGPCSATDQCPDGFECRDLWGDGRSECVRGPGSCVDSGECDPRSICASPRNGGEPRCIAPAPM